MIVMHVCSLILQMHFAGPVLCKVHGKSHQKFIQSHKAEGKSPQPFHHRSGFNYLSMKLAVERGNSSVSLEGSS